MPSHPERVRRNYHTIKVIEYPTYYMDTQVMITISRIDIASCMSKREIEREIYRLVRKGICKNRMLPE